MAHKEELPDTLLGCGSLVVTMLWGAVFLLSGLCISIVRGGDPHDYTLVPYVLGLMVTWPVPVLMALLSFLSPNRRHTCAKVTLVTFALFALGVVAVYLALFALGLFLQW